MGINSCIAVVLAPIGEATKKSGIKNKAITIFGLLTKGMKQLIKIAAVAISPTFTRPLRMFLLFNLSAYQPPHNTPVMDAVNNTNPKYKPAFGTGQPNVRLKYVGTHAVQP